MQCFIVAKNKNKKQKQKKTTVCFWVWQVSSRWIGFSSGLADLPQAAKAKESRLAQSRWRLHDCTWIFVVLLTNFYQIPVSNNYSAVFVVVRVMLVYGEKKLNQKTARKPKQRKKWSKRLCNCWEKWTWIGNTHPAFQLLFRDAGDSIFHIFAYEFCIDGPPLGWLTSFKCTERTTDT